MTQPHPRRLHPIAQALLSRVAQGAAKAGARAAEALSEAVAEEAEEMLGEVAERALDVKERLKSARKRRR